MQENINIPDSNITANLTFSQLVLMNMQQLTNFPYIEKDFDALTDYELLCLVVKFLNDVISNQNEQNTSITNMYNAFLSLQTYVNNTKDTLEEAFNNLDNYVRYYFDNLDVQEEIDNKLDQMLEDGVLEQIIEQFLQSTALWCFDTVADLINATNLISGSYAKTLGYYNINDGGAALYKITDEEIESNYQEVLSNNLYATLIIENTININQLGAYGDGVHDDTNIFQYIFNNNLANVKTILLKGNYLISNELTISNNIKIKGINPTNSYNSDSSKIIINSNITPFNLKNKSNIVIEDLIIEHPQTNTNTIFNLSNSKYITLKNIIVTHNSNLNCNLNVIDDTVNSDVSDFSGYFIFDNIKCTKYNIGIKSKATYIKIVNCSLANCSVYGVWLLNEGIGGIEECVISKGNLTGNYALRYDGHYMINIQNSYLENYYLNEAIINTNDVPVNIKGCKIFEREVTNGVLIYNDSTLKPNCLTNTNNSYINGYPSLQNMIVNGRIKDSLRAWKIKGTATYKANDNTINIPNKFNGCVEIGRTSGDSGIYQKISNNFKKDEYLTIGAWIFNPSTNDINPQIKMGYTSDDGYTITTSTATTNFRVSAKKGQWNYITAIIKVNDNLDNIAIQFLISGSNNYFYITGITLTRGINSNMDATYTPNEDKVITDKLILKGTDNNYYNISYDGTNFTATQVTNFD